MRDGKEVPIEELPLRAAAARGIEVRDVELDVAFTDGAVVNLFGHAAPLLYRPGQPLKEVMTRRQIDVLLGIMEGYQFSAVQTPLEPGDVLLLFTDGVTDASDVQNNTFGVKGVQDALRDAGAAGPQALIDRVARAVQQHAAGRATAFDDITLAALGRDR